MLPDVDLIADGLWRRLRDVVLAAERLERFRFAPEHPEGDARVGWVGELATEPGLEEAALDLTRRAVAAAAESLNHRILSALDPEVGVPLAALARLVEAPTLAVAERVTELVQVGLAVHALEEGAVRVTAAGRAWLRLLEAIGGGVAERARRELPALLGRREASR